MLGPKPGGFFQLKINVNTSMYYSHMPHWRAGQNVYPVDKYNRAQNVEGSYFHHIDSSCNLGLFLLIPAFKQKPGSLAHCWLVAPWVI